MLLSKSFATNKDTYTLKNDFQDKSVSVCICSDCASDGILAIALLEILSKKKCDITILTPGSDITEFISKGDTEDDVVRIAIGIGSGEFGSTEETVTKYENKVNADMFRVVQKSKLDKITDNTCVYGDEVAIPIGVSTKLLKKYWKFIFDDVVVYYMFEKVSLSLLILI